MKSIAVVTGSRAEYGILKPLIHQIIEEDKMNLSLIVTGLHLLEAYGSTIDSIRADGIPIDATIEMYDESDDTRTYYGSALARAIEGITAELSRIAPDIVVVLGDRLEPLSATLAAVLLKIPVAHLHGGDRTDSGLIDESIRNAITRFASLHLVAIEEHGERLLRMGEEPWRIHVVGSMGLDTILNRETVSLPEISRRIGFNLDRQTILVVFHPVVPQEDSGRQMSQIAEALRFLKKKTIVLYPNNDPGSEEVISEIEKLAGLSYVKITRSLPHDDYIDLMKNVAVMVGNSSSGIIEAASALLPVVNIGTRQASRGRSPNIIDVEPDKGQIIAAITKSLEDSEFLQGLENLTNPYGNGKTAERVVDILKSTKIDERLLRKSVTY